MLSPGAFRLLADTVVIAHLGYVAFVLLGALLVLRWRWIVWLHMPAAVWGVFVEYAGWICPLTPVEHYLRERAGMAAYQGDFIEYYVLPLLYPARLTRETQLWLGSLALSVNALVYWRLIQIRRHRA